MPAVHAALCELGIAPSPAAPPEEVGDELLWEVPDPDAASGCYAWLAGEAGVVKTLRRRLVGDLGVPAGPWRSWATGGRAPRRDPGPRRLQRSRRTGTTIGVPATGSGTTRASRSKTSASSCSVSTSSGDPEATSAPSSIATSRCA